jgi:hypothetical protein
MGIDFAAAKGIKPELLEQAQKGEAAMSKTSATDNDSLAISGGGGSDAQRSIEEVLQKSQNDLTKVRQIISQGGFTGAEKDKYTMSLHHAEWVHSRNLYMKCDNNIKETSVKYTALVDGKAQSHEIAKAHKVWKDTREKCQKSGADLSEKANQYIETDRRARANKKAEEDIYPSVGPQGFQVRGGSGGRSGGGGVEGFAGLGGDELKEGFDFYNGSAAVANGDIVAATGTTPAVKTFNARLPRYKDASRSISATDEQTILPWADYYTNCSGVTGEADKAKCEIANKAKDNYIDSINNLFDKADWLLNTYHKLHKVDQVTTTEVEKILLNNSDITSIMNNQKKNIALYKQNALYDYEEYNSLSFYEDLVGFLYYAVFVIFLVMSLRDFFSSVGGAYDKRNIIILILLGIYPKYILPVVLWMLTGLTKITEMIGLKNERFWRE